LVARIIPVDPFDLVIFGGTGDLARRKILPSLYRRMADGQMPEEARVIGAARSELDDDGYRDIVREALHEFVPGAVQDEAAIARFLDSVGYEQVDAKGDGGWRALAARIRDDVVRAFYFSVGPSLFEPLAERLHAHGIATPESRIVFANVSFAAGTPREVLTPGLIDAVYGVEVIIHDHPAAGLMIQPLRPSPVRGKDREGTSGERAA